METSHSIVSSTESERSDSSEVPALGDLDEDECAAESNGMGTMKSGIRRSRRRSPLRYLGYAIALWTVEFVLVMVLKKCGLIKPEFRLDEAVKHNVLPQLELLEQELRARLNESMPLAYLAQENKRPGFQLAQQGAVAHYPVVLIPGFVTSGLEVWGGKPCAKKFFRQRLWAAFGGARSFLMERDCWKEHMMLDPATGGDPEGIRVRAAAGFEAADYFLANYWVWGKLIENLADVGYTPSIMTMEPYDWRLAFPLLESRDGYLTRLRSRVEDMHKTSGKKVVLTSHSMGALLVHYFFAWVTTSERDGGGGGGRRWVEEHIHSYINLAGSHLGVPKAATALLSGEMSDTAAMGTIGNMVEQFFGRRLRRELWSSWGSLWAMLPKGGDKIWGIGADLCRSRTSDADPFCSDRGSPLLAMTTTGPQHTEADSFANTGGVCSPNNTFLSMRQHMVEDTLDFLQASQGSENAASALYSLYGEEKASHRTWHDPTRTQLPFAPSLQIYCMYGTGIDTERAYYYKPNWDDSIEKKNHPINQTEPSIVLDTSVEGDESNTKYGVRYVDGDGSVPLISLGYLCADAWTRRDSGLNPSDAKVITREYKHQSEFCVEDPMRGGPRSADHVDVLGNVDMTGDFLRIVTDFESDKVSRNKIESNIRELAAEINRRGGIFRRRSKRRRHSV